MNSKPPKENEIQNFIIPFAKLSGLTSFASMGIIKKNLDIKKIGHTGTLDLFADGLLVLVSGQYTRLADIICAEKKSYDAWIEFGHQTDTLDPVGDIVMNKPLPSYHDLIKILPKFIGKQDQYPPKFSAIKIKGKRASDRIRNGEEIELKARPIEIFNIKLISALNEKKIEIQNTCEKVKFSRIKIDCSKGTYIRSLARDIALQANSCAFLKALRRTAVGIFKVEDSVAFSELQDFSVLPKFWNEKENMNMEKKTLNKENILDEIFSKALRFTPNLASSLNIDCLHLQAQYLDSFKNGKPIKKNWFFSLNENSPNESLNKYRKDISQYKKIAVFHQNKFIGLVSKEKNFKYISVFN